jgi:hypothetical protein
VQRERLPSWLRRVVDLKAISLKVPQEVSGTQAVCTRFMLLRVCW